MENAPNGDSAMNTDSNYPGTDTLRRGILLRSIVSAIAVARDPNFARYLSWDGKNYVLNNADGTYAAITIDGANVVGVFFDSQSPLSPYRSSEKYGIEVFFRGMPTPLRSIAENQTLRYNRQIYRGETVPIITAAFWSDGEFLTAAFPWQEVLQNGAYIIRVELSSDTNAALNEWQDSYQCSSEEIALARSLFERKMSDPLQPIVLSKQEVESLRRLSKTSEALADSLRALEPIGIMPSRSGESKNLTN